MKSSKECEPCSNLKTNTTTSPVESANLYGDLLIRSILTVRDMENGLIKMGVDCLCVQMLRWVQILHQP